MASLALQLDKIDACSSNNICDSAEQITKLFPKCRPRSDVNLNPIVVSTKENEFNENALYTIMNIERNTTKNEEILLVNDATTKQYTNQSLEEQSSDEDDDNEKYSDELIVDHSDPNKDSKVVILTTNKGGTYKIHDSRIIEIAGGREIFSQSRSKATRKSRYNSSNDELDKKRSHKSINNQGVWELRRSCNEVKKLKTNREFTETIFSSEVSSIRHKRTEKEDENSETTVNKQNVNEEATANSDIIVFDDIDEPETSLNYSENTTKNSNDTTVHENSNIGMISEEINEVESNKNNVAKVIGNLPIAVYDGSPRRYGPRYTDAANQSHRNLPTAHSLLASPSMYLPRPGFPQRITCTSSSSSQHDADTDVTIAVTESEKVTPITSTFDYLYEFSETRKVLEEFFKCPPAEEENKYEADFQDLDYELRRQAKENNGSSYVGQRLAKCLNEQNDIYVCVDGIKKQNNGNTFLGLQEHELLEHENNFLDLSVGTGSSGDLGETEVGLQVDHSRNFTLSPETTDCDSNCGDLDSEVSLMLIDELGPSIGLMGSSGDLGMLTDSTRLYSSMPVLEDGLSSGHASDTDNNNPTVLLMKKQIIEIEHEISHRSRNENKKMKTENEISNSKECLKIINVPSPDGSVHSYKSESENLENNVENMVISDITPPPPAPAAHRSVTDEHSPYDVEAAIKDIRLTLQRTKALPLKSVTNNEECEESTSSPIWVPRRGVPAPTDSDTRKIRSGEECGEEEEADTDLETDRLLGQQRSDDQGFYDEKDKESKKKARSKEAFYDPSVLIEGVLFRARYLGSTQLVCEGQPTKTTRMMQAEEAVSRIKDASNQMSQSLWHSDVNAQNGLDDVATLNGDFIDDENIEIAMKKCADNQPQVYPKQLPLGVNAAGTVFRLQYLGSVEVEEEGGRKHRKRLKKNMVEEAVIKIKAPDGETQPSTEVDLFISTEKIMVLNTDLKEIMMDHALRTISYIADIGDLVVLMARRRFSPHEIEDPPKISRTPKMICHVFESEEAQFIAQSIGQAFQVAYMEFLKANGIEDHSFVKEMDYQEVLNSQEIFGDELQMFAKKEMQKEVVVPKAKGEILGVVIVESGWGSMLPTVVIANLAPVGAAARCGHLNIGDQIIAINGVSLVGLPLSTCQHYIKNTKNQTVVKLTVVPCAPVVEVKIKRPDTKYQLGFSVQNGVICSLLRGGIAERGGVRVGHRIIEINNQSVVAVPHEKIVNLLATSVGEILMKTMPTSMFRLLTGQENPVYI